MRFAIAAVALAAFSARAVAQDDASQVTTTITKTLSMVHTETVYGQSASSTASSVESKTSSVAEETSAAPVATPTVGQNGVNGAASMSFDMMLAVVAAGAVTFWSL